MVAIDRRFWNRKRVLITGHTGFKGSWLSLCLKARGAELFGYALAPPSEPSLFDLADVGRQLTSVTGDIRDYKLLHDRIADWRPEIVFHLAAQSLVRRSYQDAVETYSTNVLGTVHLLEAVREACDDCVVVNVTSDKCYENMEWARGYREDDRLGGRDPYSSSKACAELVTAAYRNAYFSQTGPNRRRVGLASARAGNVIGGGDWAEDRLVPDCIRALSAGRAVEVRNPTAFRPWQHVLEPLGGYLLLAERLWSDPDRFARAWNFGPSDDDAWPVHRVVDRVIALWGGGSGMETAPGENPYEAHHLKLDCSLARSELDWQPRTDLGTGLQWTVSWHRRVHAGEDPATVTREQIEQFFRGST
ncbi:MAG: CDP-glucose 4,6-dehydratase [Proteobacteria bacterium]|nr:CDP-glucose 4,6-dehydratase [Pseudomonadota bacterium]